MTRHRPYHPMNPRSGISPAHRTVPGYCYASSDGEDGKRGGILSYLALAPIGAGDVGSRPTANYSLLTANWSFTFSAKEKDVETGLSYFGSRYYSSDLSIWLSVDPQSDKYASLSPYVYCADNPVKLVDPNGEEVYIIGDDVEAVLKQLQNQTSLKLSISKDGKLDYEGTANSQIDDLIKNAIDDKNITVNMINSKDKNFGRGIVINNGGGYGGNYYEDGKVCTEQFVCPSNLEWLDNAVGDKVGLTMVHELAESFYGGTIAMSKKEGSPDSRDINSTYPQAHMFANYIAVGDFDHHPLFFRDVPAFMSDKDAKLIGIPYVEIWKRGQ